MGETQPAKTKSRPGRGEVCHSGLPVLIDPVEVPCHPKGLPAHHSRLTE